MKRNFEMVAYWKFQKVYRLRAQLHEFKENFGSDFLESIQQYDRLLVGRK